MKNKNVLLSLESILSNSNIEKGSIHYIEYLMRNEIPFYIFYEQCSRNKSQVIEYLAKKGFPQLSDDYIFSSSEAAVKWLSSKADLFKKVAYLGGRGLKEAIDTSSLQLNYSSPDAVLIGLNREVSYKDYNDILQYILNGAEFLSIDNRKTQVYEGINMIGNGSVVKMLEEASNRKALRFGRGSEMLVYLVMTHFSLEKENTILVSDDFYKDLLPAMNLNIDTTLITNGSSIEGYGFDEAYHPTGIADTYYGLIK